MNELETVGAITAGSLTYVGAWLATSRMFFTRWRSAWMDKSIEDGIQKTRHKNPDAEVVITEAYLKSLHVRYAKTDQQGEHKFAAFAAGAVWPMVLPLHLTFRNPQPSLMEARAHQGIQEQRVKDLESKLDAELRRSTQDLEHRIEMSRGGRSVGDAAQ